MVRSMPALSWRNYVGLSLRRLRGFRSVRGPALRGTAGGRERSPGPTVTLACTASPTGVSEAEIVRRRLFEHFARPGRHARRTAPSPPIRQDRAAPLAARPFGAHLPGRLRRGGGRRLSDRPQLPRTVRRGRRDQRLGPRRVPAPGAAQGVSRPAHPGRPRRVERPRPRPLRPPRRRHPPRRRPPGLVPVLPLRPPPHLADAGGRRYLDHQPVHRRVLDRSRSIPAPRSLLGPDEPAHVTSRSGFTIALRDSVSRCLDGQSTLER